MRAPRNWPAVIAGLALWAAAPAPAAEIPVWPHEQQARLRDVEKEVLDMQRKLSVARLNNDQRTVEQLSKPFKTLQDERVQLIRATQGQLPSE